MSDSVVSAVWESDSGVPPAEKGVVWGRRSIVGPFVPEKEEEMLTVLPIRYVSDVQACREFYAGLGLEFDADASVGVWAQLSAGAGAVGLHDFSVSKGRPAGSVELGFATDEKLEVIASRLREQGYVYEIFGEDFGRSLRVVDPDGVTIQIQEIDMDVARASESALARTEGE
ncbi:VOC family protein [Nocardia xishanensis]|uniref:VOC family protein n=1 Tax=Nocardia xishanensis TaxID=238964 RepID=UPI003423C75A